MKKRDNGKATIKRYKQFPFEEGYCLASCLQSVLDARKIRILPQEEIASCFKIHRSKKNKGLEIDLDSLNRFLGQFNLHSELKIPRQEFSCIKPDFVLKEALRKGLDVLVAYSSNIFHSQKNSDEFLGCSENESSDSIFRHDRKKHPGHVSLVAGFLEGKLKEVVLFDSDFPDLYLDFSLYDLVKAVEQANCSNAGFYIIA